MEDSLMNHLGPSIADHRSTRQPAGLSALGLARPSFVLVGSPAPIRCGVLL